MAAADIVVRDGFIPPVRVRALRECAARRRARGDFKAARVGADERLRRREEVRGDATCWLEEPLFDEERALLADIEKLRLDLNREDMLGLFEHELHYALYPIGTGYARHVDQLHGREQRVVSVIVYLNEDWAADDGGELRLFGAGDHAGDGGRSAVHRDIAPLGGRLVYFLTAGREHAVLPARRERLSVSGWLRRRK